ncbi:MAG TPA: hypothetical protein VHL54_05395 [Actinomycetota bacterium]|nr:hypothetical protein [Actinomycetota bacterium]
MVKLGSLFPNFKSWSNFRLMLVLGTTATIVSLAVGAVVVQAALSNGTNTDTPTAQETEAAEPDTETRTEQEVSPREEGPAEAPATRSGVTETRPDSGADFDVTCPVTETTSLTNTCQVESFRGFSGRVELSCADLPRNLSCSFTPDSVVPRTNGSSTFRLQLTAGDIPPGPYVFTIVGRSGDKVRTHPYPWGVRAPEVAVESPPAGRPVAPPNPPAATPAPAEPTFAFTCGSLSEGGKVPWSLSEDGPVVKINCFLAPLNGFDEEVEFEFAQPNGLAKPDTISFILDQLKAKKLFDLTFELGDVVKALPPEELEEGVDYPFEVTGTSASGKSLTRQVVLTVTK